MPEGSSGTVPEDALDVGPDDGSDTAPDGAFDAAPIRRTQHSKGAMMLAAGMFAIDELLRRKPREDAPIVVDANGQPVDIDLEGISLMVATDGGPDGGTVDVAVVAPPQPRSAPLSSPRRGSARRRGR